MLVFLELNGMEIECSDEEMVTLGLGIAAGQYKDEEKEAWIERMRRSGEKRSSSYNA